MYIPIKENAIHGGTQRVYRFPNGYGASVINHSFSYGNHLGLYELAVLKFNNDDNFEICYDTNITDDVIGYLDEDKVQYFLKRIEDLRCMVFG